MKSIGSVLARRTCSLHSRVACSTLSTQKRFNNGLTEQVTAVLGSQWGDEGKGKLVDILAQKYDICARFNGGANAGHTLVVNGKKFAMHLLPCGVFNPKIVNVIGNGVVIHFPTLVDEIQMLLNNDIPIENRFKISDRAHITFDFHQEIDGILEEKRDDKRVKGGSIGTTRRGIGPTYASKMYRNSIRVGELRDWDSFKTRYNQLLESCREQFNLSYNGKAELARFENYRNLVLPMIDDTIFYVNRARQNDKRILIEGANAAMLDIDFGTYPMVTASNTTHGGIATGLGLALSHVNSRIGVVKAYTTRVGFGPFPTEQTGELGDHLQSVGGEYGATTGRMRRCGWLDIPLLHYSHLINDYSSINLTKLDVFDALDEIYIATHYSINGQRLAYGAMPASMDELAQIKVEYITMPGWKQDISECQKYSDLPHNAQNYVSKVEQLLGVPVSWIGVGPGREAMVGNGFDFHL